MELAEREMRSTVSRDYDPEPGQWYEDLDRDEVFKVLSESLSVQISRLKSALDGPLGAVNRELERLGLPVIVPGTAELKTEG